MAFFSVFYGFMHYYYMPPSKSGKNSRQDKYPSYIRTQDGRIFVRTGYDTWEQRIADRTKPGLLIVGSAQPGHFERVSEMFLTRPETFIDYMHGSNIYGFDPELKVGNRPIFFRPEGHGHFVHGKVITEAVGPHMTAEPPKKKPKRR